mgnify:CR=1 FL=1
MIIIYAVLDTNVLVSALLSSNVRDSAPFSVMQHALAGRIVPLFCEKILNEYTDVLLREKFSFDPALVTLLIEELKKRGEMLEPVSCDAFFPDPDDAVFYETVLAKASDTRSFLVTGNRKHFPDSAFVLTPRQMLDLIEITDSL